MEQSINRGLLGYKETGKTYTCRAKPTNHKKLKSSKKALQELIDNAKKHETAFNCRQQVVLAHVRQSYRKKSINIVELLIKENNSYTLMKRKYHTSSKKPILTKKQATVITLVKKQLKQNLINCLQKNQGIAWNK